MFDYGASHSFIAASCVNVLGLKVESLRNSLHVSSPLRIRVRIDQICRDCELEISGILLTMDLRVMDMSDFDVILSMDLLTAHRVIIDCDRRRITAYTLKSAKLIYVLSSFHMLFCSFCIHIHVKLIKFPLNLVL